MNKYEHIFFDLDNTLWDFEANSKETLLEMYNEHLSDSLDVNSFETFFEKYVEINGIFWNLYRHGKVSKSDLRLNRFNETLLTFGLDNIKMAEFIAQEYLKICPYKTKLMEGAIEILDHLREKNYPMVIITNGFEEVQHIKMKNCGLNKYFESIITSEKIGCKKPYPEIFQHAFKTVDAKAKSSIMIGDNHDSDIIGANNLGMDSVYLQLGELPNNFRGRWIIEKLSELKTIL